MIQAAQKRGIFYLVAGREKTASTQIDQRPMMLLAMFSPVLALRSFPAANKNMKSKEPVELRSGSGWLTATNSFFNRSTKNLVISRSSNDLCIDSIRCDGSRSDRKAVVE